MGNWDTYALWQFSAHPNCNKRRCLYRVPGTESNIDVNVSTLTIAEFDKAWPFDGLVPEKKLEIISDPNILMVSTDKPETKVVSKEVVTVSIVAPVVEKSEEDIVLSKEARFQLASITLDEIAVPTARIRETVIAAAVIPEARERDDEPSYGITTTDYEPEYDVVIPKSEHAEDLTMQLQYLSGAL